jgi:two-component system OmpR family sensor kinase
MSEAPETTNNEKNGALPTGQGLHLFGTMFKTMFRKPRSLRNKLALWNALVLLLAVLLLGTIVYLWVTFQMVSDLDSQLQTQGTKLANDARQLQSANISADLPFLQQLARSIPVSEYTTNSLSIKIFDRRDGHLLAVSPFLTQVLVPFNYADFQAALQGKHVLATFKNANGDEVHTLTFPLYDKIGQLVAVAQVSQSMVVVRHVQTILVVVLGLGGLLAALIAYIVSFFFTNYELRPLSRLISTMHQLSAQQLQARFHPRIFNTEIMLLAEAFNHLLDRLEESFTSQRNFITDISHELRTPLTAIQGQIDVLLLDPELDGFREDLQHISAELGRLSRLVSNLLASARANTGALPQPFVNGIRPVELDAVLIDVARQVSSLVQQGKLEIGRLEQVRVPGDADMLKQVLLNLVDNALKYIAPTGKVLLELIRASDAEHESALRTPGQFAFPQWPQENHESGPLPSPAQDEPSSGGTWAVLIVCDTGPGIAPEDLPHIFERYYRAAQGRARSRQGTGLGLAIARMIVQAHGGDIEVKSELGTGTCFRVWLPTSVGAARL